MADGNIIEHLEIRNADIVLCFTCPNYRKRINECVSNLLIDESQPDMNKTLTGQITFSSEGGAQLKATFNFN